MLSNKLYVGIAAIIVFVAGSGYIVYAGRPVMKIDQAPNVAQQMPTDSDTEAEAEDEEEDEEEIEDALVPAPTTAPTSPTPVTLTGTVTKGTYTMSDVQAHNTQADCWSAIGGDVYDLTSWVSRHPGGANKIIGLCGKDGTAAYSGKHGSAARPKAMLILLKIGTLN